MENVAGQFVVSEPRSATLKGLSTPVEVVTIDWRVANRSGES
jgi:hypothetical protein